MKKICCLLIAALCIVAFGACQSRSVTPSSSSQASSASEAPPSSVSEPEYVPPMPSSGTVWTYAALAGTYTSQDLNIEAQYRPALTLKEDGSFSFTVNLLSAMGEVTGTYEIRNDIELVMVVTTVNFEGFSADGVTEVLFDIVSDRSLMFRGIDADADQSIGSTQPYDLFEKD